MKQKLFAIKSPSKILLWDTAASSRTKAWDLAYQRHLHRQYMHSENPTKAAYSRGWRCVQVRLVEMSNVQIEPPSRLLAKVGSNAGLGTAVSPAPTFGEPEK